MLRKQQTAVFLASLIFQLRFQYDTHSITWQIQPPHHAVDHL